jgi:hypothetical protein
MYIIVIVYFLEQREASFSLWWDCGFFFDKITGGMGKAKFREPLN